MRSGLFGLSRMLIGGLAGAAAALAAGGASAETSYPRSRDAETLSAWLRTAAGIGPDQVVAVSPSAAVAVVARTATAGGKVDLVLRAEALTAEAADRAGVLAWQMRLSADCNTGLVRTGETMGYAARTPDGEPVTMAPARSEWRRPASGTVLESAWRAACDGRFHPPLAPDLVKASTGGVGEVAETPVPRGARRVQVISSPVQADTDRRLAALRMRFGAELAGLETRVETAQVRGRTVYRGLVAGFADQDAAAAFCAELKRRGQDCLSR